MDTAVPARLRAAADPDLPPPRRPRDGRHGGADPDQGRPGSQRDGAREGARRQAARSHGRPRRHLGRAPGAGAVAREIFDAHMPGPTSSTQREDVQRHRARICCGPEGTRTEAGLRHNIHVGMQYLEAWLRGHGLRSALQPDGRRGDRGNLAAPRSGNGFAMARRSTTVSRVTVARFGADVDEEMAAACERSGGERSTQGAWPRRARCSSGSHCADELEEFLTLPPTSCLLERGASHDPRARQPATARSRHDDAGPAPSTVLDADARTRSRWEGITRPYTAADVERLRGSIADRAHAGRAWAPSGCGSCCTRAPMSRALGALTGNQAVQMVRAGLKAIYLSGWQVAADANTAGQMYPDQSLYPADSVPNVVRRINQALQRADQIEHAEGKRGARLVRADRGRRRGRLRRAAQRLRADEGDDRGGRGGRALRGPARVREEVRPHGRQGAGADRPVHPHAGRRAAGRRRDGRADAAHRAHRRQQRQAAHLATSTSATGRSSPASAPPRASSGCKGGLGLAIARGLAYAPYADLIWCETSDAGSGGGAALRRGHPRQVPRQAAGLQLLAVVQLEEEPRRATIATLPARAGRDGLQVPVRDPGRLPRAQPRHVRAGARLPGERHGGLLRAAAGEFAAERHGYTATRHQREVGTGYFDEVAQVIAGGDSSTLALRDRPRRSSSSLRLPAKHDFLDRLEANYAGDGISHDPDLGATALSRGR